jgi:hypothetical protein
LHAWIKLPVLPGVTDELLKLFNVPPETVKVDVFEMVIDPTLFANVPGPVTVMGVFELANCVNVLV